MAINLIYSPDANIVGSAANQAGFGKYLLEQQARAQAQQREQERLAEQQYQFDQELGMRQEQFGQGQYEFDEQLALRQQAQDSQEEQDAFQRQMAGREEYLQRYGLMQRGAAAEQAQQNSAMQAEYGLAQEAMQQEGMDRREGQQLASQAEIAAQSRNTAMAKAQWDEYQQKFAPHMDPDERQDWEDQFAQHWGRMNIPMPVEMPQAALPEWMDPDAQWRKANAYAEQQRAVGNEVFFVPDENGMPSRMRGEPAWGQTPQGAQQQHEFDMEKERDKRASEIDGKEQELQYKAADKQVEIENKEKAANIAQIAAASKARLEIQKEILSARRALMEALKPMKDAEGNLVKPDIDTKAFTDEIEQMEQQYKAITIPPAYVPPSQQMGGVFDAATGTMPVSEQAGGGSAIIGPNKAGRYARKHPDGRVELLPEGFAP